MLKIMDLMFEEAGKSGDCGGKVLEDGFKTQCTN